MMLLVAEKNVKIAVVKVWLVENLGPICLEGLSEGQLLTRHENIKTRSNK